MGDDNGNVLLDRNGKGADAKAEFELKRKIIGRKVTAVRFCSDEEYESGKSGTTVTLAFEDGGSFMLATHDGGIEMFVSMGNEEQPPARFVN